MKLKKPSMAYHLRRMFSSIKLSPNPLGKASGPGATTMSCDKEFHSLVKEEDAFCMRSMLSFFFLTLLQPFQPLPPPAADVVGLARHTR